MRRTVAAVGVATALVGGCGVAALRGRLAEPVAFGVRGSAFGLADRDDPDAVVAHDGDPSWYEVPYRPGHTLRVETSLAPERDGVRILRVEPVVDDPGLRLAGVVTSDSRYTLAGAVPFHPFTVTRADWGYVGIDLEMCCPDRRAPGSVTVLRSLRVTYRWHGRTRTTLAPIGSGTTVVVTG